MITEDYVSFEVAKLLREKGFDEYCRFVYNAGVLRSVASLDCHWNEGYGELIEEKQNSDFGKYDNAISAPTLQMTTKWLRTIYNIDIEIPAEVGILGTKVYVPMISTYRNRKNAPEKIEQLKFGLYYKDAKDGIPALKYYKTKEEACEAAIKYCLEKLI